MDPAVVKTPPLCKRTTVELHIPSTGVSRLTEPWQRNFGGIIYNMKRDIQGNHLFSNLRRYFILLSFLLGNKCWRGIFSI